MLKNINANVKRINMYIMNYILEGLILLVMVVTIYLWMYIIGHTRQPIGSILYNEKRK